MELLSFSSWELSLVFSCVALSLACLLGLCTALRIANRFSRHEPPRFARPDTYFDEDGEANDESTQTFSRSKWQRVSLVLSSAVGLVASLAVFVSPSRANGHQIAALAAQVGIWALVALQVTALCLERWPTERFTLSKCIAGTATLTIPVPALTIINLASPTHSTTSEEGTLLLQTQFAQLVTALACLAFSALVPKRPDVFHDGRRVDRQGTVSALSSLSFGWAADILGQVAQNPNLGLQDLPELPHTTRSAVLVDRLEQRRAKDRQALWRLLLAAHWGALLGQMAVGALCGIVSFGPQVTLYGLMKALETRDNRIDDRVPAADTLLSPWVWVVTLAVVMLLNSVLNARLSWMVQSRLGIPVQGELVSMVFAKAMRLRDATQSLASPPGKGTGSGKGQQDTDQRSVVNLVAVDVRRIADFASSTYMVSISLVQLMVACGLLLSLVGLHSLLAGLAVFVLITPLNAFVTAELGRVQGSVMKATDSRIATLAECLQGIRQVKFSALEKQWESRVLDRRETELSWLWASVKYRVALISVWVFFPVIMSAVSLTVYSLSHGTLAAAVAFTAISIFSNLDVALASLPELVSKATDAAVSLRRIQAFLDSPEKKPSAAQLGGALSLRGATIGWPTSEGAPPRSDPFILTGLHLTFPPKDLTLVTGRTGCGKTLLLTSILGDSDLLSGTINTPSPPPATDRHDELATPANWLLPTALAYVSQTPWIENTTVRANILMHLPHLQPRYRQTLAATGLDRDLASFPDGDLTHLGANGVNLSGGQKWRVALARALYSRAGTLVVDDIFSALDAHTGRHVLRHALAGPLAAGRTRILATHHVGLCLPHAAYCVVLDQGRVQHAGSVEILAKTDVFARLGLGVDDGAGVVGGMKSAAAQQGNGHGGDDHRGERAVLPLKFTQDEQRATGSSPWVLYKSYVGSSKRFLPWTLAMLAFVAYAILLIGRSGWMAIWTGSNDNGSRPEHPLSVSEQHVLGFSLELINTSNLSMKQENGRLTWYVGIYVAISVATCLLGAARTMLLFSAALASSRGMFEDLLHTVLRAPMRWFDTVPQGRIMNRFVTDMFLLDTRLNLDLLLGLARSLEMLGVAATASIVCPPLLLPAVVFLALCMRLGSVYLAGAREIRRLESVARSPIFEQFGSCIQGLTTIRAFGMVDKYVRLMHGKIDDYSRASWHLWLLNSWVTLRLTLLVAVFSTVTASVLVRMENVTAPAAGLILSLVFRYNSTIVQAIKQYANLEMDMNAVERVVEYTAVPTEDQGGRAVPAAWPTEGLLEVDDLVVGYAPELAPTLNGVSFTILPSQRVGIVGRTGAGKSTLALALFRLLEARSGHVRIDGIDISGIKLHDLRSRLAVIPQDPVLFSGSLRDNLDPFGEHDDVQLYEALEQVSLAPPTVDEEEAGVFPALSTSVSAGGHNLSQGQRQLVCLARAVLSRPKILVMDEATSAIDMETDSLIQKSLRSGFGRDSTTLLVVAHRLSTVADFDCIIVMDAGKIVEFGSPRTLMGISNGMFKSLVDNSGEKEHVQEVIFGSCP